MIDNKKEPMLRITSLHRFTTLMIANVNRNVNLRSKT